MTDRVNAFLVVLEHDIRDDDVESLRQAITHFRGVLSVENNISTPSETVAQIRVRSELLTRLLGVVRES